MATLAELKQIQVNSTRDPGGDPDAVPPILPDPAIVAARELLGRIEAAIWIEADDIRATPPPRGTPEQNQDHNEAIGWAQGALDTSETLARRALKLILAAHANDTVEAILVLDDSEIETAVAAVVLLFSKGAFPGRR